MINSGTIYIGKNIEEALIASDIGVETTLKIIEKLESRVKKENYLNKESGVLFYFLFKSKLDN